MGMTDYGADVMLDSLLGIATIPATLYLALVSEEPEESDDGDDLDEPDDTAYARIAISTGAGNWSASESSASSYLNEVTFPVATQVWDKIYHWVLCTALTSGEVIVWGEFDEGFEVFDDQQITIPAEALTLTVSDEEDNVIL